MLSTGVVALAASEDAPDHGADWTTPACLSWCEAGAAIFAHLAGTYWQVFGIGAYSYRIHICFLRGLFPGAFFFGKKSGKVLVCIISGGAELMLKLINGVTLAAVMVFLCAGCTSIVDLSDESPYKEMIGRCYVLEQDMQIREACWILGDLVLTPHSPGFCLHESKEAVAKGTEIVIVAVRERWKWGTGTCAQLVLDIPGVIIPGREVSPPVCFSQPRLNWNHEKFWFRGDEIRLKEEYVKPCGDVSIH